MRARVLAGLLGTAFTGLVLAAHGLAAPARQTTPQSGVIRGRIVITDIPGGAGRPSVADLAAPRRAPVDRSTAVVYLDSAPTPAFDELRPGRARMDQRREQFVPRVLAVTVGTVVDFPNNDTTFHNVFSLSRVRTFDLGRYAPGRSGAVRFDRPGIVPISCDIHSHMSAYVLVFRHPFFAVTGAGGSYAIRDVPPGSYALRVWSELGEAAPRRVTVPEGGATEANFRIGRGGS